MKGFIRNEKCAISVFEALIWRNEVAGDEGLSHNSWKHSKSVLRLTTGSPQFHAMSSPTRFRRPTRTAVSLREFTLLIGKKLA